MELEIKCFATLSSYAPPGGRLGDVSEGATVGLVMERLGLPVDEVKIIFVNGVHAEAVAVLHHGDRVGFFPAVGGG